VVIACTQGCGRLAVPTAKAGRFYYHHDRPWLVVPLPADMKVPRCPKCNVDVLGEDDQTKITSFLDQSYREHKDLIDGIVADFRAKNAGA
jgi:hypothetical protein